MLKAGWNRVGFVFVYAVLLLHALGLTQAGTWALEGGRPAEITFIMLFYLLAVFYLVALHSLRGWSGDGLVAALPAWYVVLAAAVVLLALRYASHLPGVSSWLLSSLGQDLLSDLGLAAAPPSRQVWGGGLLWDMVGDAVVVVFLAAQPRRLARAASRSLSSRELQELPAVWLLWWRDVIDTFGDALLQVALFLAVDQRQSVIGAGYLLFTVVFLMQPHLIQRFWLLTQLYAMCVCVLQLAVRLDTAQVLLQRLDPACPLWPAHPDPQQPPPMSANSSSCWSVWVGFDPLLQQEQRDSPLALLVLMLPDLLVVASSAMVLTRAHSPAHTHPRTLTRAPTASMRFSSGRPHTLGA